MPLRTSFFNPTVLKKDITRFCPVWGLYTIGAFMVLLLLEPSANASFARDVLSLFSFMAFINLIYAGVIVMLLFGDLFQSRMCNALHAMPLRREGWFFTHAAAGLSFSLIPNALFTLTLSAFLGQYAALAWHWFWITMVEFLFFYGTALLCAMCAGNRFSMVAQYGIFHFITLLVLAVAATLYQPLLKGILMDEQAYMQFCPTYTLVEKEFILMDFYHIGEEYLATAPRLNPDSLTLLLWLGLTGLASAAGALLLYRRRHLERAGDFLSIKALTPVFMVICCIGAGILCYGISEIFLGEASYLFMAVGLVVGFFGARMLLQRTVKVFTGKSFLGFGCIAALLVGSILLTAADPLGITRYVPAREQVASVQIAHNRSGGFYDHNTVTIEDPDTIARVLEVHSDLLRTPPTSLYATGISIRYTLDSGRTVVRGYPVTQASAAAELLQDLFTSWEYMFNGIPREEMGQKLVSAKAEIYHPDGALRASLAIAADQYDELVEALWQDQQAGQLSMRFRYSKDEDDTYLGWINLSFSPQGYDSIYLDIHSFAEHTCAFLESCAQQLPEE